MRKIIITNSYEETQRFAEEFAKTHKNTRIFALYGDLGSGKTTFVQGLARGFGIVSKIISPSFIIVRQYEIKDPSNTLQSGGHAAGRQSAKIKNKTKSLKTFFHIDLYRLKDANDIAGLGLKEVIGDNQNIVVIEWPEKMGQLLPEDRVNLHFEYIDEDRRRIKID